MFRRLCVVAGAILIAITTNQVTAVADSPPIYLTNPGVYTATPSSTFSDFPGMDVEKLFDGNNATDWAIDGYLGNNSQGRDEGWVSVTLNSSYLITHLRFAPRKPTGNTDGIDRAYFWVSNTPFGVNVTSAASTNAFLGTVTGTNPNMTIGPFANFIDAEYAFASTMTGKYLLARFYNTSDGDSNRNLGARTLQIGQVGTVPEPTSVLLLLAGLALTNFSRRHHDRRIG
jgi:hypothetical protein